MKYGLMLDRNELDYIKQTLGYAVDMESLERKKIALDILSKIASLETISTINKKDYVSSSECFNEGIAGRCGSECRYYLFDGCERAEVE